MPWGKAKQAAWMRAYRARKRAGGTVLLSKAEVRRLRRLGVSPGRYLTGQRVTLDEYRDLQRQLDAKVQRIQWQSSGIRLLHDEIATLLATIEVMKSVTQSDTNALRITALEAEMAVLQADAIDAPTAEEMIGPQA